MSTSDLLAALERAETHLLDGTSTLFLTRTLREQYVASLLSNSGLSVKGASPATAALLDDLMLKQQQYASGRGSIAALQEARRAYVNSVTQDALKARPAKKLVPLGPPKKLRPLKKSEVAKIALDNAKKTNAPIGTVATLEKRYDDAKSKETTTGLRDLAIATAPAWGLLALRWFKIL